VRGVIGSRTDPDLERAKAKALADIAELALDPSFAIGGGKR
jgi:hypothetical protein